MIPSCVKELKMGCSGAVQRTAPPSVFRRALRAVGSGELWASRQMVSVVLRELLMADQPRRLTEREREILGLIASGYPNREIAGLLFISRETVRWHVRTLYKKLGIRDRNHAIAFARGATDLTTAKPPQKAFSSPKTLEVPSLHE